MWLKYYATDVKIAPSKHDAIVTMLMHLLQDPAAAQALCDCGETPEGVLALPRDSLVWQMMTAFRTLGLSRKQWNKQDPRKWTPFNERWRVEYLVEVRRTETPIETVFFFDECYVKRGKNPWVWWYQGGRVRNARTPVGAHTCAGEKVYREDKHNTGDEGTYTINAIIGLEPLMHGRVSFCA